MDYHQNACLTIHRREQLARAAVLDGCTLQAAAARFQVSAKTAAKWAGRYREGGSQALELRRLRWNVAPQIYVILSTAKNLTHDPRAHPSHTRRAFSVPASLSPCPLW